MAAISRQNESARNARSMETLLNVHLFKFLKTATRPVATLVGILDVLPLDQ
jgi:hypothetical protein